MDYLLVDPLGRPTVTKVVIIVFTHVVRLSVCTSDRPSTFQNLAKIFHATCENVGLAEWIIDDSCFVYSFFLIL